MKKLYRSVRIVTKFILNQMIRVFFGYAYYARRKGVSIGSNCRIYVKYWGTEPHLISIGDEVTIARGVEFLTHDGSYGMIKEHGKRKYFYGGIEIGNNVFVGVNSIILPGIIIGNNVVIGAGTVVTKSIPDNSVAAGNPVRIIGSYDDFRKKVLKRGTDEKC